MPVWIGTGAASASVMLLLLSSPLSPDEEAAPFVLPCRAYVKGLRGKGNFGTFIPKGAAAKPFAGSYHLGEDVWLPGGTPVLSIGDGLVRYSDFSPTWQDKNGGMHWNLGNVVVIEHPVPNAVKEESRICSFYVHLGADRRVKAGQKVRRGQRIGTIGRHRSEENGRYPAHLHFGIHRGPYHQISPAWRADLVERARKVGLPAGKGRRLIRGEIEIRRIGETALLVSFPATGHKLGLSLLMAASTPSVRPEPIMGWCHGYGNALTLREWLPPARWIAAQAGGPSANEADICIRYKPRKGAVDSYRLTREVETVVKASGGRTRPVRSRSRFLLDWTERCRPEGRVGGLKVTCRYQRIRYKLSSKISKCDIDTKRPPSRKDLLGPALVRLCGMQMAFLRTDRGVIEGSRGVRGEIDKRLAPLSKESWMAVVRAMIDRLFQPEPITDPWLALSQVLPDRIPIKGKWVTEASVALPLDTGNTRVPCPLKLTWKYAGPSTVGGVPCHRLEMEGSLPGLVSDGNGKAARRVTLIEKPRFKAGLWYDRDGGRLIRQDVTFSARFTHHRFSAPVRLDRRETWTAVKKTRSRQSITKRLVLEFLKSAQAR